MRQNKAIQIIELIGLIFTFTVAGCSSYATDCRKEGFNLTRQAFASIEPTPDVYEVVELKNVKVFIVGDRKLFNWEKAAVCGSPIEGYANIKNEIRVLGKRVGDKIVVNQAILGHELNHLLNFKNPKIANPDKLDEIGL